MVWPDPANTMAEQPDQPEQSDAQPAAEAQPDARAKTKVSLLVRWRGLLGSLFTPRGLAILLIVSLVVHGFAYAYYRLAGADATVPPHEIELGQFQFVPAETEVGPIAGAEFSLYVTLLQGFDRSGREQLARHRRRVQQDIEQLLRQAHAGDFEDPCLTELKRRIQAQVNKSLGVRAVADVIITGLELKFSPEAAQPEAQAAQAPAWLDDAAG